MLGRFTASEGFFSALSERAPPNPAMAAWGRPGAGKHKHSPVRLRRSQQTSRNDNRLLKIEQFSIVRSGTTRCPQECRVHAQSDIRAADHARPVDIRHVRLAVPRRASRRSGRTRSFMIRRGRRRSFTTNCRPRCAGRQTTITISWSSRRCSTRWCSPSRCLVRDRDSIFILAWLYVGLRVVHSLVQATVNRVAIRFPLFVAATLVLFAMAVRGSLIVL